MTDGQTLERERPSSSNGGSRGTGPHDQVAEHRFGRRSEAFLGLQDELDRRKDDPGSGLVPVLGLILLIGWAGAMVATSLILLLVAWVARGDLLVPALATGLLGMAMAAAIPLVFRHHRRKLERIADLESRIKSVISRGAEPACPPQRQSASAMSLREYLGRNVEALRSSGVEPVKWSKVGFPLVAGLTGGGIAALFWGPTAVWVLVGILVLYLFALGLKVLIEAGG